MQFIITRFYRSKAYMGPPHGGRAIYLSGDFEGGTVFSFAWLAELCSMHSGAQVSISLLAFHWGLSLVRGHSPLHL